MNSSIKNFKIGITFSGKYRENYVEPLCNQLLNLGYTKDDIFYDAWHEELINGVHGDAMLQNIYFKYCQCVVVLLSPDYKDKNWTGHIEWSSVKELINTGRDRKICLLRVDSANIGKIDGLYQNQAIAKAIDDITAKDIAEFIDKKYKLIISNNLTPSYTNAELSSSNKRLSHNDTNNVDIFLSLHAHSGSLFFYSQDSKTKEQCCTYTLPENAWRDISNSIKKFIAELFHTETKYIVITSQNNNTKFSCAPTDGRYYDKKFRKDFDIQFITNKDPEKYDAFQLDIFKKCSFSLYKNGKSVFENIPHNTQLSYFDLEEQSVVQLIIKIIKVLNKPKRIHSENTLKNSVYSDASGGYILRFVSK